MTTEDPSIDDVRVLESFIAGTGDSSLLLTFQGILRSHERMFQELATPPADDMHAHNVSELLAEARELVASWDLKGSWTSESPIGLVGRLAAALELASAPPRRVATPPADDVREALAAVLDDSLLCWTYNGTHTVFHPTKGADAVLARFEVRPHGTVTPTPEEWAAHMDAERVRQIEHGYDDAHDAQHGAAHLLNWAIDYARRGNNLAAATMARCALRLPRGTVTDADAERAAIVADLREWSRPLGHSPEEETLRLVIARIEAHS